MKIAGMKPRNAESGFALLLVFAMAASFAIMLYMQLPRLAFEAQREKEQLLIDRGQQYSRAVQLYVRKFQRFPANMEALENTQNIRFLRKQYVDPMTGKNEWRLIHVGPGGTFIDSQVYGNQQKKSSDAPTNFITEMQPVGGTASTGGEGVNPALRRRPSDAPLPQGDPSTVNGPVMVLPDGRIVPATSTGVPAPPVPPVAPTPGQPGIPLINPPGGFQPGQATGQQPGQQPGQPGQSTGLPTSAANLINQILTTPRPQPGQGSQGGPTPGDASSSLGSGQQPAQQGQIIGGGIAGVASKYEQEGIKIYNDRSAYNQWEFVYDLTKDRARQGAQGVMPQGAPPGIQPGGPQGLPSGTGTGIVQPPK
ncbi:MAG: hypothetical protein ABJC09_05625 [Terriglobia bacterium]